MGDLREPDGGRAATDDRPSRSPWTSISSNSDPVPIRPESWGRAEKAVQNIIFKVQPTAVSEERRNRVIDYMQKLMRTSIGCEVFPYGSVPLKTYLPDGDIDLTAFGGLSSEDALIKDIISVLQAENQNNFAEFVVNDVQHIGAAEVKVVKCIVQDIVVDITFNQIGGLCTLCFLEQVDRLIGKENLFKRSIILIKAWCYYESRILGGHHGLISTYALETLVLYIFHLFRSSLNGPLAVLYKFLDFYSKFDWENYCISIFGPVRISSLPDFVVETPANVGNLSLGQWVDMFSVPSKGADSNSRTFLTKHLNIVDPLKKTNNLGRCVSQGSFFRIRSAFTYGARKLGQILMAPEDDIDEGLYKFFFNTLDRHGSGQRPDVQGPIRSPSYTGFSPAHMVSETESYQMNRLFPQTQSMSYLEITEEKASGGENRYRNDNKEHDGAAGVVPSNILVEADQTTFGKALDERIYGDSQDHAQESAGPVGAPHYVHNLYFSTSMVSDRDKGSHISDKIQTDNCRKGLSCGSDGDNGFCTENNNITGEDDVLVSAGLEDVDLAKEKAACQENLRSISLDSVSTSTPESLNPMPDLTGDYESYFRYLLYGWSCCQYSWGRVPLPMNALSPHFFQFENLWDGGQQSPPFNQNGFCHVSVNGVSPGTAFYPINPPLIPGAFFGLEEVPKPRGTGTYLPSMNRPLQSYRQSPKGRNHASSKSPRNNNRNITFMENNTLDHGIHELSQSRLSADQSPSKPGHSDVSPSFSPRGKVHPSAGALILQSHGGFEITSAGHVAAPLLDGRKQRHKKSPTSPKNSGPVSPSNGMQRLKPVRDYDRLSMKSSYHLKDDDDFPPLSL